jgi:hypothetical protein
LVALQARLHSLALYAHTGLGEGRALPLSEVDEFYAGQSFADWNKGMESKRKYAEAIMSSLGSLGQGINSVVRAIDMLIKSMSR